MTDAPLHWFDTHLRGRPACSRNARHPRGAGEGGGWRDFENWPPPATATPWFLHPGGGLSTDAPNGHARTRPVPLRPGRPDAVGRWHRHAHRWLARQPRARGASRRARVHERRARSRARDRRSGARGSPRVVEPRPHRLLRARVRRVSRRPFDERVRRAPAVHAVDDRARARRQLPRDGGDVAGGVPLRARSPCARPGVEWFAPGLRAQPRHRRVRCSPRRRCRPPTRPCSTTRRSSSRLRDREVWWNERVPGDESPGTRFPSPPQVHRSAPTIDGKLGRPGKPRAPAFAARPRPAVLPPRKNDSVGDLSIGKNERPGSNPGRSSSQPAPRRTVLPPRKNGAPDRTSVTAGCSPRGWCRAAERQGPSSPWMPTSARHRR